MEKLDKKKVLAVVLVIALIAALAGAVSLLYNSIDLFTNTTFYSSSKLSDGYNDLQEPLAIITLVAAIVAFLGVAASVISFIAKKPVLKIISIIVSVIAVLAFLACIIATSCLWTDYYKEYSWSTKYLLPHYVSFNTTVAQAYALYSGVMAVLIPQLVYFAIIAAVLLTVFIIDVKAKKANAVENNDINSIN